jgi:hypothetical protein
MVQEVCRRMRRRVAWSNTLLSISAVEPSVANKLLFDDPPQSSPDLPVLNCTRCSCT